MIPCLSVEPGRLVGTDEPVFDLSSDQPLSHLDQDGQPVVEVQGPAEWIVRAPHGRSLHVYRLAPADWLVSEVGRSSEGRGTGLEQALAALSARVSPADWWVVVAQLLHRRDPGRVPVPRSRRNVASPSRDLHGSGHDLRTVTRPAGLP